MYMVLSVDALTPPRTGIGRYVWELVSRLPSYPGIDGVRYYRQGRWIENPADLMDPAHYQLKRPWLQRQEPVWLRNMRLKRQCRGRLFHGPNYFLPPCTDVGVATIHDLSVFNYPETHPLERIRQFELHFQDTLKRATHLITDTEAISREVISRFSWPHERITAVPLGVSEDFRPRRFEEIMAVLSQYGVHYKNYALCVSTIEPRKKIDRLLAAYSRLRKEERMRFPLVLVGSVGWESESIHRQIEQCCAEGWLKYYGFVPDTDLPAMYAGARLFVYPSIYEGFGLPVLEAMASGVPVICSNCSALSEVTGGATLLVEPDDEDILRSALQTGLEDDAWRKEAVSAGLRVSSRFTWERCAELTVGVYGQIM